MTSFNKIHISMIMLGVFFLGYTGFTQNSQLQDMHQEVQGDEYIAVERSTMQRSPGYRAEETNFFTTQVNVDSDGNNLLGDAANEPSIAVDPTNPDRIVIGWRQFDTVSSNFRQAGYGYSLDGGLTWTFPGVLDPGNFRSDPVLDFDADGNFYYNSLQSTFACDVFAIRDGGVVWENPIPAGGGDKQWMRVDRTNGIGQNNIYAHWNQNFTTCDGAFIRTTDNSLSYDDCSEVPEDPFWGTLAVNAEGVLYLTGTNGSDFVVYRSLNAQNPDETIIWENGVNVNLDGQLDAGVPVNPAGLLGQAWIDVDVSNGVGAGNVYLAASVNRFSNNDPGDFMFARSTDGGLTFDDPIRINTDESVTAFQWLGTMSVAPNGRIDAAWLDSRDAPDGTNDSVLYYSFSEDQGTTWSENIPLSIPFDPNIGYPQQDKIGEYMDMVSDDEGAHLAWANTVNGEQDVYYTRILPDIVLDIDELETIINGSGFPNPFQDALTISFNIPDETAVRVDIVDIQGRHIQTLINDRRSGLQELHWNGTNTHGNIVAEGIYFVNIQSGGITEVLKILKQ